MKKYLAIILALLCVISLIGCSNNEPKEENMQNNYDPAATQAAYRSVLLENGTFISTDLEGRKIPFKDVRQVITGDESVTVDASKFVVLDLDDDKEDEVVVWLDVNGGGTAAFEILKYIDGEVYGYTLWYRAFIGLRTDGSFTYSGGASDSGVGTLVLQKDGYTVDSKTYSESRVEDNKVTVDYFVDGKATTETEFNDAFQKQLEKEDVSWLDLNTENVNSSF